MNFLDQRVFHPIIDCQPSPERERVFFREAQISVNNTWVRYGERYSTAAAIKQAFLSDLRSDLGQILAEKLRWLNLPRFETVREEFIKLCEELEV